MMLKETLQITDGVQERLTGEVVHVAMQDPQHKPDQLSIWFEDIRLSNRGFTVHGTGHKTEINEMYIGTTIDPLTGLVWHVFEVRAQ